MRKTIGDTNIFFVRNTINLELLIVCICYFAVSCASFRDGGTGCLPDVCDELTSDVKEIGHLLFQYK